MNNGSSASSHHTGNPINNNEVFERPENTCVPHLVEQCHHISAVSGTQSAQYKWLQRAEWKSVLDTAAQTDWLTDWLTDRYVNIRDILTLSQRESEREMSLINAGSSSSSSIGHLRPHDEVHILVLLYTQAAATVPAAAAAAAGGYITAASKYRPCSRVALHSVL